MTGNHDGDAVGGIGTRHGTRRGGLADGIRHLRIAARPPGRDLAKRVPDTALEGRAMGCQRQIESGTLAREIGEALGSGAYLTSLRRTRSGRFTVEEGYSMDEIINILK